MNMNYLNLSEKQVQSIIEMLIESAEQEKQLHSYYEEQCSEQREKLSKLSTEHAAAVMHVKALEEQVGELEASIENLKKIINALRAADKEVQA